MFQSRGPWCYVAGFWPAPDLPVRGTGPTPPDDPFPLCFAGCLRPSQSLSLLPLYRSNRLRWFMNHHTIWLRKNPHRHHLGQMLLIPFPLLRPPSGWLTSITWTANHIAFVHPLVGVWEGNILHIGGAPAHVAARPAPSCCPMGGSSGPWVAGLAAGGGNGGSSPSRLGGGPSS